MRLSTDEDTDDERALATIAAAVEAGVTVYGTVRAHGGNERLVARALPARGAAGPRACDGEFDDRAPSAGVS